MRVRLKFPAYAGKRLFPAGVTDEWPEGVKLPSTAQILKGDEPVEEPPEEPKEPDTLSELQKKGPVKK